MFTVNENIGRLVKYAIDHELINELDKAYAVNLLMTALKVTEYEESASFDSLPTDDLENILGELCDYAAERNFRVSRLLYLKLFFKGFQKVHRNDTHPIQ